MSKIESSDTLAAEANALFVDEHYEQALVKYNEAIQLEDKNSDLFTKRSFCFFKLDRFTESMADAKKAIELDPKNGKAWFRKGVAAFSLEEFESAKQAFVKSQEISPNPQNKTWIRKCEAEIAEDGDEDADSSGEDLSMLKGSDAPPPLEPDVDDKKPSSQPAQPKLPQATAPTPSTPSSTPVTSSVTTATPTTTQPPQTPKPGAIRHEWFQTETFVTVSVMIKGVKKEDAAVNIGKKSLETIVKLPTGSEFQLHLDLSDEVVPGESKFEILTTKIEIRLKKARTAKWPSLEDTGSKVESWGSISGSKDAKPALSYPSSSRKGEKDWGKMAASVEEEKLEGEQALNQVFQNIYKGATDEQRQAMLKSFQESGGTVLSTNWQEVGKGPVKGSPPQGMEMRKWSDLEH